jgi:hypothetical protein
VLRWLLTESNLVAIGVRDRDHHPSHEWRVGSEAMFLTRAARGQLSLAVFQLLLHCHGSPWAMLRSDPGASLSSLSDSKRFLEEWVITLLLAPHKLDLPGYVPFSQLLSIIAANKFRGV